MSILSVRKGIRLMDNSSNRIDRAFMVAKRQGQKVFMPFITAGDPSLEDTAKLMAAMRRGGADIIELGVPFSDPLADGPVIQRASVRALNNRVNLDKVLTLVSGLRSDGTLKDTPVVLLIYYNTIYVYGLDRFVEAAVKCGVDGVVVPDMPLEAGRDLRRYAAELGLHVIGIAAPTTGTGRLEEISKYASGFIYYTSVTGVTGVRDSLRNELAAEVSRVKKITDLPVLIGFGIGNKEQARQAALIFDGVIMGSALVKLVEQYPSEILPEQLEQFVAQIKEAISNI